MHDDLEESFRRRPQRGVGPIGGVIAASPIVAGCIRRGLAFAELLNGTSEPTSVGQSRVEIEVPRAWLFDASEM